MKEEIAAETGETVQEVKVVLAAVAGQDKGYAGAAIRSVDVRLVGGESENAEVDKRDDKEPISIEPVDSVQVNVESMQSERDGKAAVKENAEAVSKAEEARAEPVRDYISRRWDLEPDLITIYMPGQEQDKSCSGGEDDGKLVEAVGAMAWWRSWRSKKNANLQMVDHSWPDRRRDYAVQLLRQCEEAGS